MGYISRMYHSCRLAFTNNTAVVDNAAEVVKSKKDEGMYLYICHLHYIYFEICIHITQVRVVFRC